MQVMYAMMDADVTAVAGPKGVHDPDRVAVRHGHEDGSVTLGGRRVGVRRPRVRTADDSAEVAVPAYELFSGTEILGRMALERMLAGLSTRRYGHGLEPVGEQVAATAASTSRSAVSRRFVAATERALTELMAGDLSGLDLVAVMVDGGGVAEQLCVVALATELDKTHPGAAASLREGLQETLAVLRLGVPPTLARTLRSTNPIESMISICRTHCTNVKRWRNGQMALRWCAAGMVEAAGQF